MKSIIFGLSFLGLSACSGEKNPGKSPGFKDADILTIKGQFLNQNNEGLAQTKIALRNLRVFAYVNPSQTYIKETLNWLVYVAFPMFPTYDYKIEKVKPNYFLKDAVTARDGSFRFQIQAGQAFRC